MVCLWDSSFCVYVGVFEMLVGLFWDVFLIVWVKMCRRGFGGG